MEKELKLKLNFSNILFFLIIIFVVVSVSKVEVLKNGTSFLVLLTFVVNGIISILMILKEKKPYSLYKTYWYFVLIFYFIAPLIQYLSAYNPWHYNLYNFDYLKGNIIIFVSNIIFAFLYEYKNKIFLKRSENNKIVYPENIKIKTTFFVKCFLVALLFLCVLFAIKNIGLSHLFSRTENSYNVSANSMLNTIISLLCRCIPVYIFYIFYSENNKLNLISIFSLIIIVILNFPTSTTRFWMGAIYIGIFLIIFNKKSDNKKLYDILLLIIFTIVFPFLFSFKFHDISYFMKNGYKINSLVESYNTVDYDAYSIIPRTYTYVQDNGTVKGKQFMATLFFWVPRQIWNNKPKPTGDLIAKAQEQHYTNISCPFISEGYINFGFAGVVVFQIILSLVCFSLDTKYWYEEKCDERIRILYPFLMGFLIYLLRGALHPAIIYLFCFSIPLFMIKFLIKAGGTKNA